MAAVGGYGYAVSLVQTVDGRVQAALFSVDEFFHTGQRAVGVACEYGQGAVQARDDIDMASVRRDPDVADIV